MSLVSVHYVILLIAGYRQNYGIIIKHMLYVGITLPYICLKIENERGRHKFSDKRFECWWKINIFAFDILCAEKCAQTEVLVYTHRQWRSGSRIWQFNPDSNEWLSERVHTMLLVWIPLSCFLYYRVLPEPYSQKAWGSEFTPLFVNWRRNLMVGCMAADYLL